MLFACLGLCASSACLAQALMLSGEVVALDAQPIFTPQSNNSPVVLRVFTAEGTRVEPGDVVLRIDAGAAEQNILTLSAQIEQAQARSAQELAAARVAALDAESQLVDRDAILARAEVDAGIPAEHLSALDYDRFQGQLEQARREQALARNTLQAAQEAVQRRRDDAKLELDRLQTELEFNRIQVQSAEVRAQRSGTVIAAFEPWRGNRYAEGSSAQTGTMVGQVVGDGALAVRAYLPEAQRSQLRTGQAVELRFDALPGRVSRSTIERIAGAPEPKREWGDGRYFLIEIGINDGQIGTLLPGMSARVDLLPESAEARP